MNIPVPPPLTDDDPMPVQGRYYGVVLKDVPSHYLDWLDGQPWLAYKYPRLKAYINNPRNRKSINQDLDRE